MKGKTRIYCRQWTSQLFVAHTHTSSKDVYILCIYAQTHMGIDRTKQKKTETYGSDDSQQQRQRQPKQQQLNSMATYNNKKKQFDACGTLTKANVEKGKRENCNPTVTNKTLVCARLVCVVHTRTKKKRSRQLAASSGKGKTVLR